MKRTKRRAATYRVELAPPSPILARSCGFRRRGLDPDSAQGHVEERRPLPQLGESGGHSSAGSAAGSLRAGLMDTKIALAGQPLAVCALAH